MTLPKNSPFSYINIKDINDISKSLLSPNKKLKLFNSDFYKNLNNNEFRYFCYQYARYGIPTIELVDFINEKINGRSTIEIGSGHGDLGYHLKIPMTDSKIQLNPEIRKTYEAMQQCVIDYPDDVEKIEALDAVIKYKPQVVVGSWITTHASQPMPYGSNPFGIRELQILKRIETFIIIGNADLHKDKPILKKPHEEIQEPWIISRATNPQNNRIYIINNTL